jgi:hypothetical protein
MSYKKYGISFEKKIHNGWEEHQRLLKSKDPKAITYVKMLKSNSFGHPHPMGYFYKWHYVFTSKKGTVSLIKLLDYHRTGEHIWEILIGDCKDGNIERFYKHEDASKRIIEILRNDRDEK